VLAGLACRDPYDFEPNDPTKPDPPDPPELVQPGDGWLSDSYEYPQSVTFGWYALPGTLFYQMEVYRDSVVNPSARVYNNTRVTLNSVSVGFGWGVYVWRVRAASRNWNDYTDWSAPFRFTLPNPAD
jgi:hypothetical protein